MLSFEIAVGWPRTAEAWPKDARINTTLGGRYPLTITGDRAAVHFQADTDERAIDEANVILHAVRGSLGLHFGEPAEIANVRVQEAEGGRSLNTLPRRGWSMGWSDVSVEELETAAAFLVEVDPASAYARAADYYNQGRIQLERVGMPEAAVVLFYKVLEALSPPSKGGTEKRRRRWRVAGFSPTEIDRLERLALYRNKWDAAHADFGLGRVQMSEAHEAEETALLVLVQCASRLGLTLRPPRRQLHFVPAQDRAG